MPPESNPPLLKLNWRCTVVVADDVEATRSELVHILREGGLSVVGEASNGQEALDLFNRHLPDLVCLDISMPLMTGLEVLLEIKDKRPQTLVILVTEGVTRINVLGAITNRANGIIVKPLKAQSVYREIIRVLSEHAHRGSERD